MKYCPTCKLSKPAECFYRDNWRRGGLSSQCKVCKCARDAERKRLDTPALIQERKLKKEERDELSKQGLATCFRCKETKPFAEFFRDTACKYGRSCHCKVCKTLATKDWQSKVPPGELKRRHSSAHIRRRYGILPEDFAQIRLNQDNKCASCLEELKETPHVDHCHTTGRVRGLLCPGCNKGLGHFYDSPERLRSAANYLDKSNPLK